MKRKLAQRDDAPPPETAAPESTAAAVPAQPSFADLNLDARLVQALAKLGFEKPTHVQHRAIPLALNGRDILAKAPTGSGKTAAYLLPVMQSILRRKKTSTEACTSALILVPTRELADQVLKKFEELSAFCAKDIQAVKLAEKLPDAVQRALLANTPDIVISTPARAWNNVNSSSLSVDKLTHLVIDEADLVLSYGYEDDLERLAEAVPKGLQSIMMSATLSEDLEKLKGMGFCRNPALLDLDEQKAEGGGVAQFVVKCGEDEKFVLAYVLMKLKLLRGKCIIFVANVDRSYRLKLFFEGFGIKSCLLNQELPVNSRIHVVEEFNRNVYDILIASDENEVLGGEDKQDEGEDAEVDSNGELQKQTTEADKDAKRPKKKRKAERRDKEYGVSRGIDFRNVSVVLNFDFPVTSKSYTHRIGRTGRAGQSGMALSFVVPKDLYRKHIPTTVEAAENDEKVLAKVARQQGKLGQEIKDYVFDKKQIEAFRYRVNDCLRSVTSTAIREARTKEIRKELLQSSQLSRYFEENPAELKHLRHDGELSRPNRSQSHLKNVPAYLLPKDGKKALVSDDIGFVPFKKEGQRQRGHKKSRVKAKGFKVGRRKGDPLKTFKAGRKTK
ncbi:DEAD-domain-containing protein [Thozetella sp. PMI_491]|nr:DEAD-domain-containing protein [Thozetella sp. PMI_491]